MRLNLCLIVSFAACKGRSQVAVVVDAPAPSSCSPASDSCALPPLIERTKLDAKNVLGTALEVCSGAPLTGFFRDGRCATSEDDSGMHVVCSEVTDAFLAFSKERGNDLLTPRGSFPGLKAGNRWCLCAARWQEAEKAGVAPPVVLEATDASATRISTLGVLRAHAAKTSAMR